MNRLILVFVAGVALLLVFAAAAASSHAHDHGHGAPHAEKHDTHASHNPLHDFDLTPLLNFFKAPSLHGAEGLLSNHTFLHYVFFLSALHASSTIVQNQRRRGRFNPFYTLAASLFCIFFAYVAIPVLLEEKFHFLEDEGHVLGAVVITLLAQFGLERIYHLQPFYGAVKVLTAASYATLIAHRFNQGQQLYGTFSAGLFFALVDVVSRPLLLVLEPYFVDREDHLHSTYLRTPLAATLVYAALDGRDERLALLAAFGILALGGVADSFHAPIDWFFPLTMLFNLVGGSTNSHGHAHEGEGHGHAHGAHDEAHGHAHLASSKGASSHDSLGSSADDSAGKGRAKKEKKEKEKSH